MAAYHHVADEQRSGPLDPQHNANAMGGKQSALSIEYVDGGVSLACAIQTDQHKGSLPLEIPDSDEHPDIDDGQSSKSFETIDTELVARGTEITHKAKTTLVSVHPLLRCTEFTSLFVLQACFYTKPCVVRINSTNKVF